jgi:hypothetical protein
MIRQRNKLALAVLTTAAFASAELSQLLYQPDIPLSHPAIRYYESPLASQIPSLKLEYKPGFGYLPDVLEQLGIKQDTQALVFSKTSFQAAKIGPRNPRAIYFNDRYAVGWVRGSEDLEIEVTDPQQGAVFYAVKRGPDGKPVFDRSETCMKCHQGPQTIGVPGIFISSVFPSASGMPDSDRQSAIITDHRTKFEERWGGWYVTGLSGEQSHRGNAIAQNPAEPKVLETYGTQNLTNLLRKFDPAGYLLPSSDMIALMTFEHQTQMVNLMTRLNWELRIAGKETREIDSRIEDVAQYMTFYGEDELKEPVKGVSTFTETFPKQGPRDHKGRSLRDFDLQTRLFRYRLSYMIYSPQFDALPDWVRAKIYARLKAAADPAALEILRDTKNDLAF